MPPAAQKEAAVATVAPAAVEIWPGQPYPLGATYVGVGVNFAVFSEVAERIELCLFHDDGNEIRVHLPEASSFVWHVAHEEGRLVLPPDSVALLRLA